MTDAEKSLGNAEYQALPTADDERLIHYAVISDELWSAKCHPEWKWDVPLARHMQQVTCLLWVMCGLTK